MIHILLHHILTCFGVFFCSEHDAADITMKIHSVYRYIQWKWNLAIHIFLWQALSQKKIIFAGNIYGEMKASVMTYWMISNHLQGQVWKPVSILVESDAAARCALSLMQIEVHIYNVLQYSFFLQFGYIACLGFSVMEAQELFSYLWKNACQVLLCALSCLTTTQYRWQQRSDTLAEFM